MYNSVRGRFMTPDPIGLKSATQKRPQSLNRYAYVNNDPVNFIDPLGLARVIWTCTTRRVVRNDRWVYETICNYQTIEEGGGGEADEEAPDETEEPLDQGGGINVTEIMNHAIARAKHLLGSVSACAELFGTLDTDDFLANHVSVGTIDQNGAPFNSEAVAARARSNRDSNGNRIASGSVVFNQNSFFFTGTLGGQNFMGLLTDEVRQRNGLGNLNFAQQQVLIILHELMHIVDTAGNHDHNADNPNSHRDLNNLIRSKCFPESDL